MTVDTTSAGGGELLPYDDPSFTGLEDFETSRMMVPRLGIAHREAKFTSPFDKTEKWDSPLTTVVLGVAKQRLLWHVKLGEVGDLPLCKSSDGLLGYPTPPENLKDGKVFPWDISGFDPAMSPISDNGMHELSCQNCGCKEWGSHPLGSKPYCNEQYTFVTLVPAPGADPNNTEELFPALFSVQRTSLRSAESYMTTFKVAREPMFKAFTELRLELVSKGGNDYSVVRFRRLNATPMEMWPEYRMLAFQILDAIKRKPAGITTEDDPVEVTRPGTGGGQPPAATPTRPATPTPARPATPAANRPAAAQPAAAAVPPPAAEEDDDLPF